MPSRRTAASLFAVALTVLPAGAQDGPRRADTPDEYEERAVQRAAERVVRAADTEGHRWQRELARAYPDKIGPGLTEDEVGKWFDVLAGDARGWRKDAAPTRAVGELFDRMAHRLELGPVPSIRRDEFLSYAKRNLIVRTPSDRRDDRPAERSPDADRAFRVLDRDGSGALEPGEWTERLRADRRTADADGNRRVDAGEYRTYFDARVTEAGEAAAKAAAAARAPAPAARGGALPAWFAKLDTDADGQVGLYEWRTAGRDVAEFTKMDLDGDGLLPPDEYLRFVRTAEAETRAADAKTKESPVVPPERQAGGRDKADKRY